MQTRVQGLIAATLTPLKKDGSVETLGIPDLVEHLIAQHIAGLYVCGSTGEGISLSTQERMRVAAAYIEAVNGRIPVFVQVGHNSLAEAQDLAAHAQAIGAAAISATCPSYFKINSVEVLTDCMAEIATAAPALPFYYYHIPSLTGSALSMPAFLELAANKIQNLVGLKFTTPELHAFQECSLVQDGRFEVLWGTDEMLLPALACGAKAAIGSTYNIAPALYQRIIHEFQQNRLDQARQLQILAVKMIALMVKYPFHSALKSILSMQGFELGPCRLPLQTITPEAFGELTHELQQLGFDEWSLNR